MVDQNKRLDELFHNFSKFTIILPLVIVVLAIFWKFEGGRDARQKSYMEPVLTPTSAKAKDILGSLREAAEPTTSAKFNLKGPLNCNFSTDEATLTAHVLDKKIYLMVDEKEGVKNYLMSGDCVYMWEKGSYSGEKICGISQQVNMIETLLSSNFLNPSFILGNLNQAFPLPTLGGFQNPLESVLNSCKKEATPSATLFDIPRNVLFKNKQR